MLQTSPPYVVAAINPALLHIILFIEELSRPWEINVRNGPVFKEW